MKHFWYIIVLQIVMLNAVQAQSYKSTLANGNQSFGVKNYTKAEQTYRKASAKDKVNTASLYNKANSIYKMQSMNEAVSSYQTALKNAKTKEEKHQIFHNMGNAFMKQKNYSGAVEAYKNALRNNPNDEQTRYNYALAKKMQKENPDQNKDNKDNKDKKDQNKDQNKDQKDKNDQNKDQDKKDQDKKDPKDDKGDQDKKDQQDQNKDDKGDKDKEQPKPNPQQQKQNQSKQQMENMLKALDNHEQGVRERIQGREQKGKPVTTPTTKDW
ncbi:tetratricopeptide repeat protein [Flavobacterium sp. xlx-214]|uniref:tetratricopeptide repeat protein n=1 Tax=unclassified Flavobacterium TaxID=196869 RepID=UPI0013D82532|nr:MULTISPECIES: tetratricopeptide repeat protein [unclassified Flavobacterium]MBA5793650.1 tetratricopeptide repeat protein [Flavobacterium sp. xlx-221]QMI84577.1 tetratricopeptide repeat protein [Flavobacterium sp. xlx-214]